MRGKRKKTCFDVMMKISFCSVGSLSDLWGVWKDGKSALLLRLAVWRMGTLKGRTAGVMGVLGKQKGPWWVSGRSPLGCPPTRGTALQALGQASLVPGQCLSMQGSGVLGNRMGPVLEL